MCYPQNRPPLVFLAVRPPFAHCSQTVDFARSQVYGRGSKPREREKRAFLIICVIQKRTASHGGTAAPGAQVHSPDTRPLAELGLRSSHTPGSQGHVWEASGLEFSAHVILGLNRIRGGFACVGRQDADRVSPQKAGRPPLSSHRI